MLVETYECQETVAEPLEASDEAVQIIESLDLTGQKELLTPEEEGRSSRFPYREITLTERFIYTTLCPKAVPLREYKQSPIPLRVLQIAAHADSLGFLSELVVWAAEPAAEPDPVLIGVVKDGYSEKAVYILARWGEVLDEWPILCKRALAKGREKTLAKLQAIKGRVEAALAEIPSVDLDTLIQKRDPSFYD